MATQLSQRTPIQELTQYTEPPSQRILGILVIWKSLPELPAPTSIGGSITAPLIGTKGPQLNFLRKNVSNLYDDIKTLQHKKFILNTQKISMFTLAL